MLILITIWNLTVFIIYSYDKMSAIKNKRRISEKTLLISAFLLGGVGALCSMHLLRHKTKHLRFMILVPISFIVTIILTFFLSGI